MTVTKRNGSCVAFDKQKIISAMQKAFKETYGEINADMISCSEKVANEIEGMGKDLGVEEIQDLVEKKLMATKYKDVAKVYINYRFLHKMARSQYTELMEAVGGKLAGKDIENQNANVDEHSFGGRVGEATRIVTKKFALEYIVSPMAKANHENNEIYIHDLDNYAVGNHNCLSIPFDELLANGFNTRQTDVRPAQSVNTAFQLVAVIFQLQSLQQFGGVSATHLDWTMVPYVRKSFYKHFRDGIKYCMREQWDEHWDDFTPERPIDWDEYQNYPEAYEYAMDMTTKEVYQAVEGMYHNLKNIWATKQ